MKNLLLYRKGLVNLLGIMMPLLFTLVSVSKTQAQCNGTIFPAPADILANAPEAANYNLVYKLPIPTDNQAWTDQSQIPYSINNSAALASTNYTRIAYYMKLQSIYLGVQWVWVSFDKFTSDVTLTGIPTGSTIWQQQVTNMNVANYSGISKTGITGNVEIWPNCYTSNNANAVPGASDDIFDFGDAPTIDQTCSYGSFQVHDFNSQFTLLSYNGWASSTGTAEDLGVDNFTLGQPDWTFAGNANLYDVKELYVFVNAPGPGTCNNTTISLNASGTASLIPAMVNNAVPGNCGIQSVSVSKTNFTCADLGNNNVTVTLTDINNNITTCNAVVTVADPIAPVIVATGTTLNLGLNPSPADIEAALGTATVTDNCGTPALNVLTEPVFVSGCTSFQARRWDATDAAGNAAVQAVRIVQWTTDATPPVIVATGTTLNLAPNPSAADIEAALGTATATDDCGAATLTVATGAVTTTGCSNSQTRTWDATDAVGNPAITVTRTVTWTIDIIAPVITATGTSNNLGYNPSAATINAALGTATATDNCDNPIPTFTDGPVITDGCNSRQTRTWNVSDASGNPATPVSRTVVWKTDAIAPVIVATGTTLTLGLNPSAAAIEAALGTATVTDNCGTPTLTVATGAVIITGCSNSQTRTWNANDPAGNPAIPVSRTVTWTGDNTAPVIVATGTTLNLGLNPSAAAIEAALGTATATDNCGTPTLTVSTASVIITGCVKSQTRTWNATDPSGNPAIPVTRTVTWTSDNIAPVIVATGTTLSLGLNPSAAAIEAALGTATATDNCGTPTLTVTTAAVITTGCVKSQTRTWNATDPSGNPAIPVTRTVTWTSDGTPPVIVATGTTLSLGLNPSAAAIEAALGTATATDNCGTPTLTVSTGPVIITGCTKSQKRTWNATDPSGNPAVPVSRTVTWTNDNTPPVIVATGTTLSLGLNPSAATIEAALGTATVSDNCGTPTLTVSTGQVIVTGCVKSQTRTWNATDPSGNPAVPVTRTVTWTNDNTPPVIVATGTTLNLGFNPSASAIQAALGTATATDNCGTPTLTVSTGQVIVVGCVKSQTRTWNAIDPSGNAATPVSRTVTWSSDNIPPVIHATGTTLTLGFFPSSSAINAALGTATATDNCGTPTLTVTNSTVTTNGCYKSQTRTWTAVDPSGNTSTVSRTVTWIQDNTPPVITATGTTLTLGCNPSSSAINAALGTATAIDNCSFAIMINFNSPVSSNGCSRSQTRTWYAIDLFFNVATPVSRTVTWTSDLTPPVINATGSTLTLSCNPSNTAIQAALGTATATDNCGTPTLTVVTSSVTVSNSGVSSQKRTWTAQDACGNVSSTSRTVTWPKCNNFANTPETNNAKISADKNILPDHLVVSVLNNPATTYFSLHIESKNSSPVTVRVSDSYGRTIYLNEQVAPNASLHIGDKWFSGTYIAEVLQGDERKLVKMIKLD